SVVLVVVEVLSVDEVEVDVDELVSLADLLPPHPATATTNVASASKVVTRRMTLPFRSVFANAPRAGPPNRPYQPFGFREGALPAERGAVPSSEAQGIQRKETGMRTLERRR